MNHLDHTPADGLVTERGMAARLVDALSETDERLASFDTFEDVGLLTRNTGVIVRLDNGQEFQITVVEDSRKRPATTVWSDEPEACPDCGSDDLGVSCASADREDEADIVECENCGWAAALTPEGRAAMQGDR